MLRRIALGLVLLDHVSALGGVPSFNPLSQFYPGLPVRLAFVVSGFVMWGAFKASPSAPAFWLGRLQRLYPLYALGVVIPAVFLVAITERDVVGFFLSWDWVAYLAANLSLLNFVHPTLPGVFAGLPHPEINGALWTMKVEFQLYLALPLLSRLGRHLGVTPALTLALLLSSAWPTLTSGYWQGSTFERLDNQLPGQLAFFAAGCLCEHHWARVSRSPAALAAAVVTLTGVAAVGPFETARLMNAVVLAAWVILASCTVEQAVKPGNSRLIYASFLVHFPVINLLVYFGLSTRPVELVFWSILGTGLSATALLSIDAVIRRSCGEWFGLTDARGRAGHAARFWSDSRIT